MLQLISNMPNQNLATTKVFARETESNRSCLDSCLQENVSLDHTCLDNCLKKPVPRIGKFLFLSDETINFEHFITKQKLKDIDKSTMIKLKTVLVISFFRLYFRQIMFLFRSNFEYIRLLPGCISTFWSTLCADFEANAYLVLFDIARKI